MPLFKTWNISRTMKKAVVANSLEELIKKGTEKLNIQDGECHVFDESDGTEIDDDECLLTYEKGAVFILGRHWRPAIATEEFKQETDTMGELAQGSDDNPTGEIGQGHGEFQLETDETDPMGEVETDETDGMGKVNQGYESYQETNETDPTGDVHQGYEFDQETDPTVEVDQRLDEGNVEMPSDAARTSDKKKLDQNQAEKDDLATSTPRPTTFMNILRDNKYINAKMKNIKIYTEEEIANPKSEMERKRRRFWNEKAEQLVKSSKTSHCGKTTIAGIIDVAWTLRKTSFIEGEARKLIEDEKELFAKDEIESGRKLGQQKSDTIAKNLDRMAAAHLAVESHDGDIEKCQKEFKNGKSLQEKNASTVKYKRQKALIDGAYTELKRAQEATLKSIKIKRQQLEIRLRARTDDSEAEPEEALSPEVKRKKI